MSLECCSGVCHARPCHFLLEFGKRRHKVDKQATIRIAANLWLADDRDCDILLPQ